MLTPIVPGGESDPLEDQAFVCAQVEIVPVCNQKLALHVQSVSTRTKLLPAIQDRVQTICFCCVQQLVHLNTVTISVDTGRMS